MYFIYNLLVKALYRTCTTLIKWIGANKQLLVKVGHGAWGRGHGATVYRRLTLMSGSLSIPLNPPY